MPVSTFWTALPNGVDGDSLVLSAFVSFRVTTADGNDALLSAFPDLARWPESLLDLSFMVQVDGADPVPATLATTLPTGELWRALFPPDDTVVRSHQVQDFSGNPRSSFSVLANRDLLRNLHATTGVSGPGRRPDWSGDRRQGPQQLLQVFALDHREAHRLAGDPAATDPRAQVAKLIDFYTRADEPQQPSVPLPTPDQLRAHFDFAKIMSQLGNHPALFRPLGIVFDLRIPLGAVPAVPGAQPQLRVLPTWTAADPGMAPPASPPTLASFDGMSFTASSVTGDLQDGWLVVDGQQQRYELVELDVEGGVLKAAGFANNVVRPSAESTLATLTEAGLPALRSAGLSLVRDGRADAVGQVLSANAAVEPAMAGDAADAVVTAEQLVRGWRLDVWDSRTRGWHSLIERTGRYHFVNDPTQDRTVSDEGFVQLAVGAAAKLPDSIGIEPADKLYVHESLARWDGWSLAAPRPGLGVSSSPDPADPPMPADGDTGSGTTAGIETTFRARGLPQLRFGTGYRFRARAVDLAGNSRPLDDPDDSFALPRSPHGLTYRRFEPVAAPMVSLTRTIGPDDPGESLARIVVRTFNDSPDRDDGPIAARAVRQLSPPAGSVALAEAHGVLDGPDGRLSGDAATYAMLAARDGAALPVDASDPAHPVPVVPDGPLDVPYLADPLARGLALRDLPGTSGPARLVVDETGALTTVPLSGRAVRPGSATLLRWSGTWPQRAGIRLVLAGGSGEPTWSDNDQVLTARLPPSFVREVRLSSLIDTADLQLLGVWEWLRQALEPGPHLVDLDIDSQADLDAAVALISQFAVEGGLWQLTPDRTLTLVHAVQQPLGLPRITSLAAAREVGSTSASLGGVLAVHGRSTAKIDLLATWEDPVDDPAAATPSVATGQGTATELILDDPEHDSAVAVAGTPVGFYDATAETIALGYPPPPSDAATFPQHEFHDHKHRVVEYTPVAASRFRDYFAADVPGGVTRTGPAVMVSIPSSRRPDAPGLRYVVPSFAWEREEETNLRSHRRSGGLRIFLDRGWWSSGAGELLGVVLWPTPIFPPNRRDQLARYVTRVGSDPIYQSIQPAIPALTFEFPDATRTGSGLRLEELPNDLVDVAGHEVQWDDERKLWFVDLQIDVGESYHPMVRLALARYQPESTPGTELSRVVLADFAALPMDRSLLLTYDPYDPDDVAVTVSGPTYHATAGADNSVVPGGSTVQVHVQRRVAGVADADLAWQDAPEVLVTADTAARQDALLWHGHVALPADRAPGDYRVVVQEIEMLLVDPTIILRGRVAPEPVAGGPHPRLPGLLPPQSAGGVGQAEAESSALAAGRLPPLFFEPHPAPRVVFVDTFEL
jgi:hypothetical protein